MHIYKKYLVVLLLVVVVFTETKAAREYFSSMTGMESLLRTEKVFAADFRQYLAAARQKLDAFEGQLNKIENEHKIAEENMENYLTNPISVYLLIKRLYSDWFSFEERIRHDQEATYFLNLMAKNKRLLDYPSEDDMYGSALALIRLQETYKLQTEQMAQGVLNGISYGTRMGWHDCYELGRQLHEIGAFNHTKLWLRQSADLLENDKGATIATSIALTEAIAESLLTLGDVERAYELSSKVLQLNAERQKAWDIAFKAENMLKDKSIPIPVYTSQLFDDDAYYQTNEYQTYEKLCRAEIQQTPRQQRPLRCRYVHNNHPALFLSPFKVEEHNLDPFVITVHNALSDHRADAIRNMAIPRMKRSTVRSPTASIKSNVRVSQNAWVPYDEHSYLQDMLRDLNHLTGLNTSISEELQVANYGLGGHYEPHWDFYLENEMTMLEGDEGNRLSTAIFYLSDVQQGGATVFPYLNISVFPKKGNILFWYNLHRSLDRDFRTRHGGCPVLKGSKWIANIWIHDITQTFTRPCDIHRDHEKSLDFEVIKY